MLDIYARSMMTATRHDRVHLREIPPAHQTSKRRWFSRRKVIEIDPSEL